MRRRSGELGDNAASDDGRDLIPAIFLIPVADGAALFIERDLLRLAQAQT
jgi:hypothetical protein